MRQSVLGDPIKRLFRVWAVCVPVFFTVLAPLAVSETPPRKSSLELPEDASTVHDVRVLVRKQSGPVNIETDKPFWVLDRNRRPLFRGDRMAATPVVAQDNAIRLGAQIFRSAPVTVESTDGSVLLDGKPYRFSLTFRPLGNGQMMVVNELPLEDYLRGVLPWEANPDWAKDALKAQAVASRTYALFRMIENRAEPYDVQQDVSSQVYHGKSIEKPSTDAAIHETRGEVLTYRGKIFPAFFHSTSGGATTRADYIWNIEPHPSLMGVQTEFSAASKHYRWKDDFASADILNVLRAHGAGNLASLDEIRLLEIDASGRARRFEFRSGKTRIAVSSADFRMWMNPGKFKSTKIEAVQKRGDRFLFQGFGWGHGVGLCQYSAKQLGELGYNYREILKYFYPGSELTFYGAEDRDTMTQS